MELPPHGLGSTVSATWGGRIRLPRAQARVQAELIRGLTVTKDQLVAAPTGPGEFSLEIIDGFFPGERTFRYRFQQPFQAAGMPFTLILRNLDYLVQDQRPLTESLVFDDPYLDRRLELSIQLGSQAYEDRVAFQGCGLPTAPASRFHVVGSRGEQADLFVREFPVVQEIDPTPPARLVQAIVSLPEGTRVVSDYWHLVYAGGHHNVNQKLWALFDPPLGEVHGIELREQEIGNGAPASFVTLDAQLRPQRTITITEFAQCDEQEFVRGDADGDGRGTLADAIYTLNYLFLARPAPPVADAADANDDGALNLTDAVYLLNHLFTGGRPPPPPYLEAGTDPTADTLPEPAGCP